MANEPLRQGVGASRGLGGVLAGRQAHRQRVGRQDRQDLEFGYGPGGDSSCPPQRALLLIKTLGLGGTRSVQQRRLAGHQRQQRRHSACQPHLACKSYLLILRANPAESDDQLRGPC
jgi:hypothetical protein